jgi:serine/threonine-protein kinase HipA
VADAHKTERSRLTRSSHPALAVLPCGALTGHVRRSANRRLVVCDDDAWRGRVGAFPLSLSMPLHAVEHARRATSAYLWGVLPEDPRVITYWACLHGVSRNDVVGILAHVGGDCAGAVQIVAVDGVDRVLGASTEIDEETCSE